ncbi:MAG: biosynthetic-type acetolactate synthase large subunit, partial [Mobilicoccus sp.]|nr:biosynthetic-type acetolactate synthase large subunit [Mobilicoccus sp.]
DAFQEADIRGITMPITKHNYLITDPDDIPRAIAEAFHIASTGRPGPVLVDITKDALQARTSFSWPPKLDLPNYRPVTKPHAKQIREAAKLIAAARRPVFYLGGGVVRSGASEQMRELVDLTQIPLVTTLMGRGVVPDDHELHLGMPGMHGSVSAVTALQKADLLIALGVRFDDRVTGKLATFAPLAKVIHADIDPAEVGKNRVADVPMVGDCAEVATELARELREQGYAPDLDAWHTETASWKERYPLGWTEPETGLLSPQYVIKRIGELTGPEAIYAAGVGQHQMWAAQFIDYQRPNSWLNSGGLGTMGYCVPAAMGAKAGAPDRVVWGIDGDGCFQMTNQELATCVINNIPIKIAVINNSSLGMVRQWQTLFYEGRYSNTDLNTGHDTVRVPDFVKLADAYGCVGLRCESVDDVDATIKQALEINDRPVVIDFVVCRDAMVWPMVPAGVSNDEIMYARGMSPVWDREETAVDAEADMTAELIEQEQEGASR